MSRIHLNIRQKLMTLTICLVVMVVVAIALFSVYEGREKVMETFEEQSRGMAQILADGLVQDLYFRNISALDDRIKVTLAQPSGFMIVRGNPCTPSTKQTKPTVPVRRSICRGRQ